MGMDTIEFVMAVEESFGIDIPNDVATQLATPRLLSDHLVSRLPAGERSCCLGQVAFYRLRRAVLAEFRLARTVIRPATPWPAILPSGHLRDAWTRLGAASGLPTWPRLTWFGRFVGDASTVGNTARFVAAYCASSLKGEGAGWTRSEVESVVISLLQHQFGLTRVNLDAHFVRDLKLD